MMLAVIMTIVALQAGLAIHYSRVYADAESTRFGLSASRSSRCALGLDESIVRRRIAVRSVEKWLNRLIEDGIRRSATVTALVATIATHRAIVYIEPRDSLSGGLTGAVPAVVVRAPDGTRYARVWLLRGRAPDEMIEVIAHELQHVIELLEIEAGERSSKDQRQTTSFPRFPTGFRMIETDAARGVGEATHRELLECGRHSAASR